MRQLWLPTFFNETDYPWASDFIRVLGQTFGPGYNLEIMDGYTMKSMLAEANKRVICFKKVVREGILCVIDSARSVALQRRWWFH